MKCKRCGHVNEEENVYCIKCGKKLRHNNKRIIIISIIITLIVLALLGVGTYFLFFRNGENVNTEIVDSNSDFEGRYYPLVYDKNSGDVEWYSFYNEKVEYCNGLDEYNGTYTKDDKIIKITFTEYYDHSNPDLPKEAISTNKELIIDEENKLLDSQNTNNYVYVKSNDLIVEKYIGEWYSNEDERNYIDIEKIYRDDITFSISLYINGFFVQVEPITASLQAGNVATFNTSEEWIAKYYQGVYGTLEFKDNQIDLEITSSSSQYIPVGTKCTYTMHQDTNVEEPTLLEATDMTGIHGMYLLAENNESGDIKYYTIQDSQVQYIEIGKKCIIREGTYTRQGDKLHITYDKQYNVIYDVVDLDIQNEDLTIDNDKLNSENGTYTKFLLRNVVLGCWTDETEGANEVNIKKLDLNNNTFTFDLGIYRMCLIEDITATMQSDTFATFNTDDTDMSGVDGTIEFRDNTVILRITYSLQEVVENNLTFTCDHIMEVEDY